MKKFTFGKVVCVAGAAAMFGLSGAQVTKQGAGYLFRMKFTKGSKANYVMNMDSNMSGQKVKVNMKMTQTVTAVNNGVGTLKFNIGAMTMSMNGKPMQNPAAGQMGKTVEMKMDSRGKVVGGASTGQQTSVPLPANPVAIGKSWTETTTTPAMGQSVTVRATYKFVGIEGSAAKLSISLTGTGQFSMSGNGFVWLDMADGSLLKSTTNVKMMMGQTPMPMVMTMTRK